MQQRFIHSLAQVKNSLLAQITNSTTSRSIGFAKENLTEDKPSVCAISATDFHDLSSHTTCMSNVNRWLIVRLKDIRATYNNNPDILPDVLDKIYYTLELYISRNMKNVTKFIDRIKAIDEQLQLEVTSIRYLDNLKKLESFKNFHKAYQKALVRTQIEGNI